MRISYRAAALVLTLATATTTAHAGQIIAANNGLSGTDHLIDFGANLFPNFTDITTQFPGAIFSHTRYFTTGAVNNMVGGFLTNDFSGPPNTLTVKFDHPIEDLSFAYHQVGTGQASVFRVLLGGVLVDSFVNTSDQFQPNNYFGFTGLLFDELQLDFVVDFNIDTLAYNDPNSTSSGAPFCSGDGSATPCPCGNGPTGAGCANSSGSGARLVASGTPDTSSDTFVLQVSDSVPGKPGLVFQGSAALGGGNGIQLGNGLLCFTSQKRWSVQFADAGGAATYGPGLFSTHPDAVPGATLLYQWWYRDTADPCGGGFNLSNAWSATWQ